MRNLSPELLDSFNREDLSLCRCVVITLVGGAEYFLTDLNSEVTFDGDVYYPEPAIDVAAIRTSQNTNLQSTEIKMTYDDPDLLGGLTERAIRFGLLGDATGLNLLTGSISSVEQPSRSYCVMNVSSAQVGGLSSLVAEVYSKRCRNVFGDKRCGVDVDALSVPFTVIKVYPNRALFAINGFVDGVPPVVAPEDPPRVLPTANGELLKPDFQGELDFVVPDAQILKIKMASSGGGGATSGGRYVERNNNVKITPGFPGNSAFPAYMKRTSRGEEVLFQLSGGEGGRAFPGFDQRTNTVPFAAFEKPPKAPGGRITGGTVTPTLEQPGKGGLGGVGAVSFGGSLYSNGSQSSDQGRGGDGGDGTYIEYTFQLEDPNCPIKAGDTVHFSIGSAGDSPTDGDEPPFGQPGHDPFSGKWDADTSPGLTGKKGRIELKWQSNVGLETGTVEEATYSAGSVKWLTGDNAGQIIQVASNTAGLISLTNTPRMTINPGDTGLLRPGCSNYADMCENRWNNLPRMQAEPVTPSDASAAPAPVADTPTDTTKPPPTPTGTDGFGGINTAYPGAPGGA
jgi:hypothetical protein